MPELPEVETIRSELFVLKGKKLKQLEVRNPKSIRFAIKDLITEKVIDISRRAKLLIIKFTGGKNLIVHLKLTGQLLFQDKNGKLFGGGHPDDKYLEGTPGSFTQVIFYFEDRSILYFNDIRKFGWMKLINDENLEDYFKDEGYGPEPLEKDFTFEKFKSLVSSKKQKIKPLLMDQKIIAGIGNIYAQEACFSAHISPLRRADSLKLEELKKLYQSLKKVLSEAIKHRGSSVDNYVDIYGKKGKFVAKLKVYGRGEKQCLVCKAILKNIKIGSRGTVFCPNCQK